MQEGVRDEPWAVSDAPGGFIEAMMKAIVGIEIQIARLEGKWKVSQNLRAADRRGVAEGLRAGRVQESEESRAMAQLVEEFSPKS